MSEATATYEQIEQAADKLTQYDKLRLLRHLATNLEQAEFHRKLAEVPVAPGWPPGFFERTAGSLAGDPIERPPQGEYEERDEIE